MARSRLVARLLGTPAFSYRGAPVAPRAVKALALLAYLARADHGAMRRDLAELLWGPERVGSVHQALHTLRRVPGGERWLSAGRGPVRLRVRCDVTVFERLVERGRYGTALTLWRGTPFAGLRVPGAPAFDDWLGLERMRLEDRRREALRGASRRLAMVGDHAEAIGLAEALLDLDPLDESAHQDVIRLHLQRGDVRAARLQYEACRDLLDRELGVEPLPETDELGDAIAAAERAIRQHTPFETIARTPPALLRPSVLVGRTAAIESVGRAWSEGRIAVLVAAAGAGKSRIVLDAADERGRYLVLEGRPGDAGIPYGSLLRAVEALLAVSDERLPRWARAELARIATDPSAGVGGDDAVPITSARTGRAVAAALRALYPSVATVVIDDLHAFDEDSRRVVLTAIAAERGGGPALAITAREGALTGPDARSLDALCASLVAVAIDLPPLDEDAIEALLSATGIDDGQALAADLVRFTGGNPLFVLEVLKGLHAEGTLDGAAGLPADLDVPLRVRRTLERRLDELDREALRAVRVLALAPDAADDLVAEVLDLDEHLVADVLGAAEDAGWLVDGGLTHAVAQEVVEAHAPRSVRRLLHRRLADGLESRGASVGVVAWHRLGAADDETAVAPVLQSAAEAALRIGPSRQAMHWLEHLVASLDDTSEHYARALLRLGAARGKVDLARGQSEVEAALDAADRHGHAAIALEALIVLARQARTAGAYARSAALLDDASHRAGNPTPTTITVDRHWVTFHLAWARGMFAEAEASLGALASLVPDDADLAYERSTLDWHMGRLERCARRLAGIDRSELETGIRGHVDHVAGLAAWALGWPARAEAFLLQALATFEALGDAQSEILVRNGMALALLGAGRFDEGRRHAVRAERLLRVHGTPLFAADAASRRALIDLHCDEAEDAERALQGAWEAVEGVSDPYRRSTILSVWTGASAAVGDTDGALARAAEALRLAERIDQPLARAVAERALSVAARYAGDADAAAEHARRSALRAARHGMSEQQGHALVMQARAYELAGRDDTRDLAREARALGRERALPHLAWLAGTVLVRSGDEGAQAEVDHLQARLRARSPSGRLLEL